jgi:hypothetical protein
MGVEPLPRGQLIDPKRSWAGSRPWQRGIGYAPLGWPPGMRTTRIGETSLAKFGFEDDSHWHCDPVKGVGTAHPKSGAASPIGW